MRDTPELSTWRALNDALRGSNEKTCRTLLAKEKRGLNRQRFLLRIHSRINKVRADRERRELRSI